MDRVHFYEISSSWNVVLRVFAAVEALVCIRIRKGTTALAPPLHCPCSSTPPCPGSISPPSWSQSTQQHLG